MKRVNWEAKSEFQYIENYKLLQAAFTKQRVQKRVDVDRLIRGKYQDNLEQCQWLKAFFEHASADNREDYDALARRRMGKGGKKLSDIFLPRGMNMNINVNGNGSNNMKRSMSSSSSVGGASIVNSTSTRTRPIKSSSSSSVVSSARSVTSTRTGPPSVRDGNSRPSARQANSSKAHAASVAAEKKVQKLEGQNKELMQQQALLKRKNAETEIILENIEKERDFYFEKLRGIEVMLQVHEEDGEKSDAEIIIQRVFKVLYAKIEDNITVTDDGELLENIANGHGGEDLLNESNISMLSADADADVDVDVDVGAVYDHEAVENVAIGAVYDHEAVENVAVGSI